MLLLNGLPTGNPPNPALLLSSGVVVELTTSWLAVFGFTNVPLIGFPRAPGVTVVPEITTALGATVMI